MSIQSKTIKALTNKTYKLFVLKILNFSIDLNSLTCIKDRITFQWNNWQISSLVSTKVKTYHHYLPHVPATINCIKRIAKASIVPYLL